LLGAPLAPYLFPFDGEALNVASKHNMDLGDLLGIQLANGSNTQLLVQFANDTNYTLLGNEADLIAITSLLHRFFLATGLESNWDKVI
jgi:hypothetical protein